MLRGRAEQLSQWDGTSIRDQFTDHVSLWETCRLLLSITLSASDRWWIAGSYCPEPGMCRFTPDDCLVGLGGLAVSGLCWEKVCLWDSGFCVHDRICLCVAGCRQRLWAHRCSPLRLLHCSCWEDPEASPLLLCGELGYSCLHAPGSVNLGAHY